MSRSSFSILLSALCIALLSCSSVDKSEKERERAWVKKLALSTLHYRRPTGAPADPLAGPGGEDYRSKPLPNGRFDCEPAKNLFSKMKLEAIRSCLNGLNHASKDFILTFTLRRTLTPSLKLHPEVKKKETDPPLRPDCVNELLSEIPVPREIFFQGSGDREGLACYAAGMPAEAAPKLGIRLGAERMQVTVGMPLDHPLENDQDVELLLLSWVLKPYFDPFRQQIPARVVPDRLCRLCIGEANLVRVAVPPVPLWPDEGDLAPQTLGGSGEDVPVGTPALPEQTGTL